MKTKKYIYWTLGLVGIIASGIVGSWYYTQSRPLYCLKKAQDAYLTHNLPQFKKYVQVESVVDNLVDQFMQQTIDQATDAAFTDTETDMRMGNQIVSFLKPMFTRTLTHEVYQLVASPARLSVQTSTTGMGGVSLRQMAQPFLRHQYTLKDIAEVEIKDDKAYLTLVVVAEDQPDKPLHIQAVMSQTATHDWQLTALPNLATVLHQLQ